MYYFKILRNRVLKSFQYKRFKQNNIIKGQLKRRVNIGFKFIKSYKCKMLQQF